MSGISLEWFGLTLFRGAGSGGKLVLFMLGADGLEERRDGELHSGAMRAWQPYIRFSF